MKSQSEKQKLNAIRLRDQFLSDRAPVDSDRRVQDAIQIWSWINQPNLTEGSKDVYRTIIQAFFRFNYDVGLKEVQTPHISLFLKSDPNLSVATIALRRRVLASMFQFLEDSGYIPRNPAKPLKTEKVPEQFQFKILTIAQVERMVEVSEDHPRNQLFIRILYYISLRVSEALTLQRVSFKVGEKGIFLTVVGKGSKTRSLNVPEELWEEIKAYADSEKLGMSDFFFSTPEDRSKSISRVQALNVVKAIAKKAKVDPIPSPHWFRHTNATHALENGAPVHVVQKNHGHASMSTTGKYAHARPLESSAKYLKKMK